MEFSQRTTQIATDWQQWVGQNVTVQNGGIELTKGSTAANSASQATEGVAYRQFDAGSEAIQWHRLVVDHQSTADTQIRVAYSASDRACPLDEPLSNVCELSESTLEAAGVQTAWELLKRDPSELAAYSDQPTTAIQDAQQQTLSTVEDRLDGEWQTTEAVDDILLDAATGQYLTVQIELIGTQQSSPQITAVRASWPRQSYLQYLPEIYQKAGTDGFLEQFLAVFGTLFVELEREIETITELFDPQAAPAEALPWLAEWLGVEISEQWPTPAIRKRLAAAPEHQPTRGTKDGLRNMLALYLAHVEPAEPLDSDRLVPTENTAVGMDVDMQAVDHGLWILDTAELPEATPPLGDIDSSGSVIVYAGPFERPTHRQAVEQIVRTEMPAHVSHRLVELETTWRVGHSSVLGETSRLADGSFVLGGARLGSTTEFTDRDAASTVQTVADQS